LLCVSLNVIEYTKLKEDYEEVLFNNISILFGKTKTGDEDSPFVLTPITEADYTNM
jgi:hypothetical protein